VLYPGIERLVDSDLRVLRFLLWLDARFGSYPLESIYQELAANVPLETDLVHEGQAMEAIAAALAAQPRVVIPRVVWKHTSRTLLVMDWIDGIKVTEQARLLAAGIDVQAVADLIVDVYTRMVLQQGFFHADPHAGNLFALPGDRLAIVDFGLTKRLTPAFRRSLAKLTRAMFTADTARLLEAYAELGFEARDADDHQVFIATAEFFRTITDPATYVQGEGAMRSLNEDWARAVKANPITAFPGDLTLVSRVFSLLTGVGARMGAEPRVLPAILRYTVGDDPPPPSEARLTEGAPT
jgi:ubiquinone biosynthesis protein